MSVRSFFSDLFGKLKGKVEGRTYTVVKGDTLSAIAQRYYGDASQYDRIYRANPILKDPDKIYPGQVLVIPD